nr:hypothetical protein [Candidatus Njordarchaeota archaeon]
MRSYIFTGRERALVRKAIDKRIRLKDRRLHVVMSRLRHFKELARDVELYIRLRRLAESEGAVST